MVRYDKLVRDKIPGIIEKGGEVPKVKILSHEEYLAELDKKLNEETGEYQESKELEELADILEVVYAICEARGASIEELHRLRNQKFEERGGFSKRYFLISKE